MLQRTARREWKRKAIKHLLPITFRKARPVAVEYSIEMVRKKQRLRDLGYINTMTLYGTVIVEGKLRNKRIEVCSKLDIKQVHNAALYESVVRQDMNNPAVVAYHQRYTVLDKVKFRGIPKEDYLVLTWGELLRGAFYTHEKGEWIEYEQKT